MGHNTAQPKCGVLASPNISIWGFVCLMKIVFFRYTAIFRTNKFHFRSPLVMKYNNCLSIVFLRKRVIHSQPTRVTEAPLEVKHRDALHV